ncbi:MAG: DUF1902 domain-containing protein [Synergistaceae bacterium]|nr:DUF1902 domain-containing protein [Synergistaceae bacterium]
MNCKVKFFWDSEAAVWAAASEELPSLVLESGSFDALIEKVKYIVPELLYFEGIKADYCDLNFIAEKTCRVRTA